MTSSFKEPSCLKEPKNSETTKPFNCSSYGKNQIHSNEHILCYQRKLVLVSEPRFKDTPPVHIPALKKEIFEMMLRFLWVRQQLNFCLAFWKMTVRRQDRSHLFENQCNVWLHVYPAAWGNCFGWWVVDCSDFFSSLPLRPNIPVLRQQVAGGE